MAMIAVRDHERKTVGGGIRVFAQTNIRPQKGKYLAFPILAGRKTGFRLRIIRLLEQKTGTFSCLF